jgi:hypothetical protein
MNAQSPELQFIFRFFKTDAYLSCIQPKPCSFQYMGSTEFVKGKGLE